ncbi:CdaR family transcriptional regulator [Atopococcus tabaci]|uniref:CdaR family transcriptional regulator n=1 Tax=Atopococcus tabaci TaxID=269774 RepID=UPI0004298ADD|nr:sugar diacid recognition domain-containing protein [Atopococcus tabaci]
MELSPAIAQEIVMQMKTIIQQEINFMNNQALIIASTDSSRIGNWHGGAAKVLQTHQFLIIETDQSYKGSKKGINIPVFFEDKVIGVIGITGEKEEVQRYGEIIKKMTEILIKEDYLKDITFRKRDRSKYIIESLLNKPQVQSKEDWANEALNYDYSIPHTAVVGKSAQKMPIHEYNIVSIIESSLSFLENDHLYAIIEDNIYILFNEKNPAIIRNYLKFLGQEILNKTKVTFHFGIGLTGTSEAEARDSFSKAIDAADWAVTHTKNMLEFYENMDIGVLISSLPEKEAGYYSHKILSSIPKEEFQDLQSVFFAYGKNNKSMKKSANDLFLHKNTFQYRLNKIHSYTGYDPKQLFDYMVLYFAFMLHSE